MLLGCSTLKLQILMSRLIYLCIFMYFVLSFLLVFHKCFIDMLVLLVCCIESCPVCPTVWACLCQLSKIQYNTSNSGWVSSEPALLILMETLWNLFLSHTKTNNWQYQFLTPLYIILRNPQSKVTQILQCRYRSVNVDLGVTISDLMQSYNLDEKRCCFFFFSFQYSLTFHQRKPTKYKEYCSLNHPNPP